MIKTILKKTISIILAFLFILSLSCCGADNEIPPEETTAYETPEETTSQTLSEDELDALVQNMPEIVFVMSFVYDDRENNFGYYVTNTGEIKMYDFRSIELHGHYEIPDYYDRLEEATCDGLYRRRNGEIVGKKVISEDDLTDLSYEELVGYYKRLLLIEGNAKYIQSGFVETEWGSYTLYGIKHTDNSEKEYILLDGVGPDFIYDHSNPDALEVYKDIGAYFPHLRGETWSMQ